MKDRCSPWYSCLDSGGPEACRQEQSLYPASVASAGISLALCALLGRFLGWCLPFMSCYDAIAAVSRSAAKGGVLVCLDWPASSRPRPKPVLPWPAPVSFALLLPIAALARP